MSTPLITESASFGFSLTVIAGEPQIAGESGKRFQIDAGNSTYVQLTEWQMMKLVSTMLFYWERENCMMELQRRSQ